VLATESLPALQSALDNAGVDGWLIYDFHGLNPVAVGMLELPGMTTRRFFVYIPRKGQPVAITHAIEQGPWVNWPSKWRKEKYSSWRTLESLLGELVKGKRVAMEYSPGDAVPYLDRVPAGVIEMVRAAGAEVVSSADLVSSFYAVWTDEQRASHERAARAVATIGQEAIRLAGSRADSASPLTEYGLQGWIREKFAAGGLETDHGPIVAIGPNAANPHYEPTAENSATIKRGDILLVDLWAREENGVFADQTWMGSLGKPSDRDNAIWLAVRDARRARAHSRHRFFDRAGRLSRRGCRNAERSERVHRCRWTAHHPVQLSEGLADRLASDQVPDSGVLEAQPPQRKCAHAQLPRLPHQRGEQFLVGHPDLPSFRRCRVQRRRRMVACERNVGHGGETPCVIVADDFRLGGTAP